MIRTAILSLSAAALAAGCSSIPMPDVPKLIGGGDNPMLGRTIEASIVGREGREIGQAYLTEGPRGVFIHLDFEERALTPGWHGVHFHERGTCADAFNASGSHVGHREGRHGLLNPSGPEPGDLPSIFAPASGAFGAEFFSPFITLAQEAGDRSPVFDRDGSALVIHESADDQESQPIGGAGGRVACAILRSG